MSLATDFERTLAGPWITGGEDVQYRIDADAAAIRIFFQGSISDSDWLHNFDLAAVPYKDMPVPWKAHRGFVRLWKSVRDEIKAEVASLVTAKQRPVHVMGYSQGAAIATLCYEDLWFESDIAELHGIGFGSPQVVWGCPKIADRFDDWTHVQVRGDPVDSLWLLGYRHVGKSIRIGPCSWPSAEKHLPASYRKELANVV